MLNVLISEVSSTLLYGLLFYDIFLNVLFKDVLNWSDCVVSVMDGERSVEIWLNDS